MTSAARWRKTATDRAGRFPGWPVALIRDLGRAAQGTEAVMLSEALALLGDADAALAQYQAALPLAQQAKDYRATRELSEKIFRVTHPGSARPAAQRRQPRSRPSRSQRKGKR